MDTIESALSKITQYISELGLATWQLQVIGLGVVLILILILIRQRKIKTKPIIHNAQTRIRPDVIGIKLQSREATYSHDEDTKRQKPVSTTSKTTTYRKKTLKQTTNEWRKATEQIRQLRRELSKQKRTEEHLRQIIADLKSPNQKANAGTSESESEQSSIKPKPSILKSYDTQIQEGSQSQPVKDDSKQQSTGDTALLKENMEVIIEDENKQQNSKESGEVMHPDAQDHQDTTEEKKNNLDMEKQITESFTNTEQYQQKVIYTKDQEELTIEDEEYSQQPGVPLDVKELKAIAELAKRLRGNNRQQQEK